MNPFKKINNALNVCVDYFDYRIRTGKFIYDIKYYIDLTVNFFTRTGKKIYHYSKKSFILVLIFYLLKRLWEIVMKVKFIALFASLFGDTLRIVVAYYAEVFIVFAFTFPLTILLLNWFQTAVIAFFVGLIPILLINIYCISALYYTIERNENGEKISLWDSFHLLTPHFNRVIFPALTAMAIIQESLLGFVIFALFLGYGFQIINVSWSGSFVYWFIIFLVGFFLVIGIGLLSLVIYQAYFTVLLENLSFVRAFKKSRVNIRTSLSYYVSFYFLLYLFSVFVIWKAAVAYLYVGMTIGLYGAGTASILLGYLFWKRYHMQPLPEPETATQKMPLLFIVIIVFGFVNYILLAVFCVKEYQPFIDFVQRQEDNFIASQDMKAYTNSTYSYIVNYPQAWTVYHWNDNAITFYDNYTGTITGGTWMTIDVSSFNQAAFEPLFTAEPGLVTQTGKNLTTKITNMTIQGYDTVNYTIIKQQTPYPQYETHFLIHKGSLLYDIAFISLSNDVANYDSDLFQKIISSFQFTQ